MFTLLLDTNYFYLYISVPCNALDALDIKLIITLLHKPKSSTGKLNTMPSLATSYEDVVKVVPLVSNITVGESRVTHKVEETV